MDAKKEYERLTKNKEKFKKDLETYGDVIINKRLKFTTGGMRGILREGFNGINEVTCNILCTYLASKYTSVVIGYDSRRQSHELAIIAGRIFKKYERPVFLFKHIATPCLSYLIEPMGAEIGLMITASHNPKEYNGYKVYNKHGCQITAPLDEEIERELLNNRVTDCSDVKFTANDSVLCREEVMTIYVAGLFKGWNRRQTPFLKNSPERKILFTPLYGVSIDFVRLGVVQYNLFPLFDFFEKHCKYDPSFPGLPFPNPEVDQVYDEAKKLGHELIFSCDPDGDRFGMVEKINDSYVHYCGDEIAAIFIKYFIDNFDHTPLVFINTFLCNDFMEDISKKFKIEYYRTKTGFKNISKIINSVYKRGDKKTIFAYEDSLGFFFGKGREKDGIKCTILMGHILQETKPSEILLSLEQYGLYSTFNYHHRCVDPEKTLQTVIENLNYDKLHDMFLINYEDFKLILRRSGTEPMIKIYGSSSKLRKEDLKKRVMSFIEEKLLK